MDTKAYKIKLGKEKEKAVWQRRYWEHMIRDDNNFAKHFGTTHFNPVKQGYISKPRDWKWSSFHRYFRLGYYPEEWGCGEVCCGNENTFGE
ncbi:MAG: transposase [Calditrichaeota bacterium]|nr:transposase [Calditrichota bacterium]